MPNDIPIDPSDEMDLDFHPDDFGDFDPDIDFTDPAPVAETEMVSPPVQPAVASRMPVPRARRLLRGEVETVRAAIMSLKNLELGEKIHLSECAIDALACATLDCQLPLKESSHEIGRRRDLAVAGKLRSYVPLAMDELEDALATLEAGLAALKAISLLDEPVPAAWDNLHPLLLARKVNVIGHTLLRGRLAGVNI